MKGCLVGQVADLPVPWGRSATCPTTARNTAQESQADMDEPLHDSVDEGLAKIAEDALSVDAGVVESASAEYLGRWNRLVSTTNWEKGRIICEWRQELLAAGAPLEAATDEAWSRRAGNVSPQHVGRLRRVYQRFGEVHGQFPGLYWSHFQAALDWHDAEMWLEGAVQSGWSVAAMRTERWQAMGSPRDQRPRDEEVVSADVDEDVDAANDSAADALGPSLGEVRDPGAGEKGESDRAEAGETDLADEDAPWPDAPAAAEPVRPFENLPSLPRDLADAFEGFKLAILNHKLAGWRDTSLEDVLAVLDALRQLALAPP